MMHRSRLTELVVLGSVLALFLAEAMLRAVRPARLDVIRYPCVYQPDPILGFRYTPGAQGLVAGHFEIHNPITLNSLGFYDDEPLPLGEASPRILALGDSFTAAMNVPRDAVWTAVLERELRAQGHPKADVVNLGLDGTGTDVHLDLLRQYVPLFRPDVIVLAFFGNDILDILNGRFQRECHRSIVLSYQTDDQRGDLRDRVDAHHERRLRRWFFDHSYIARLLQLALDPLDPLLIEFLQPSAKEMGLNDAVRNSRSSRVIAAFDGLEEIARSCNCRLVIAPVPPRSNAEGSARLARKIIGKRSLEILDLLPDMELERKRDGREHADLYFFHDAHLNVYGNQLYGRTLARRLEPGL
ncbi:MAG: hypothetical protein E2O66_07425 [Deltaproteobacteria bacterium]|nr:MAG: hypothetical protein E2O66_07425 [Deltaproteobacteria bacterium]